MPARLVSHVLAAILGLAALVGGVAALAADMTMVLPVTLLIVGVLFLSLSAMSMKGSRAAWSFLVALSAVMFICMFFGVPKVRSMLEVSFTVALIAPILLGITTVMLALLYRDYDTVQ